ncbi:hypothetical protein WISP_149128 [Willisornis vidua]|uniref:Uncharacterized protein n=1 Tax=Willisornis vidua TaxID=1566151 RepID=A0ABQ9CML3_9PASS|nr:hypothetical protein WISP_149128 [Willisornis vidua]
MRDQCRAGTGAMPGLMPGAIPGRDRRALVGNGHDSVGRAGEYEAEWSPWPLVAPAGQRVQQEPVAELKEEMGRLKIIRESKREIDCWSSILPTLREAQKESEKPCHSFHQAEGGDIVDGVEWNQVPAWRASEKLDLSECSKDEASKMNSRNLSLAGERNIHDLFALEKENAVTDMCLLSGFPSMSGSRFQRAAIREDGRLVSPGY